MLVKSTQAGDGKRMYAEDLFSLALTIGPEVTIINNTA